MQSSQQNRSNRSQSLQVDFHSHRPQYINKPLQLIKQIEDQQEFQDSYGSVLKNQLIHDISSIERDYNNIERVKNNLEKIETEKQLKLNEMDQKTKQQLQLIEQNRMKQLLKKQKLKAQQNKLKREEFLDRKKEQDREKRKQYLQKLQKTQKKMEEFENQKQQQSLLRNNFQNEYQQQNKLNEIKQMQEQQEQQNIQRIMQHYQEKQNRVQQTHQRILSSTRAKISDGQYNKEAAIQRALSQKSSQEKHHIQQLVDRYEKINNAEQQKKIKDMKQMKLKIKLQKEKEEMHRENLQKANREKKKRQMTYQEKQLLLNNNNNQNNQSKSNQGSGTIIKTMQDMTLQKQQQNQIWEQAVKQNKQALQYQTDDQNSSRLYKQQYITHQRKLAKETRDKIINLRMVARFKQKEEIKMSPNKSYS